MLDIYDVHAGKLGEHGEGGDVDVHNFAELLVVDFSQIRVGARQDAYDDVWLGRVYEVSRGKGVFFEEKKGFLKNCFS